MKKSEGPLNLIDSRLTRDSKESDKMHRLLFFLSQKTNTTNKLSRHIFSFFHNPQIQCIRVCLAEVFREDHKISATIRLTPYIIAGECNKAYRQSGIIYSESNYCTQTRWLCWLTVK